MSNSKNIEDPYKRKFGSVRKQIQKEIEHFNVNKLSLYSGNTPIP